MRIGHIVTICAFTVACQQQTPPGNGAPGADSGITAGSGSDDGIPPATGIPGGGTGGATDGNAGGEEVTGGCDISANVALGTPTVVLLVDQSGSMDADFESTIRWDAVYDTLMDPTDGIVQKLESSVRFGLTLYTGISDYDDDEGLPDECPYLTSIGPALDNYATIDAMYSGQSWLDDTPTGESLEAVAADLAAFPEDGAKIIVLATDGEPDTCAEPNPQEGQEVALAAAEKAFDMGIQTFIVAVGPEVSETHQQEMANVGVGKDRNDPAPAPYYQALDPATLVAAFEQIIGSVINCQFTINGDVVVDLACQGTVLLDGQPLECGTDWRVLDPKTLELIGDACEVLQDGSPHSVEANFPCGVYIP
jgi:hypothetical protein